MKTQIARLVALSAVVLSSLAHAQGLTRAEVRQQLIEAEQNGSLNYTDASYPEVNPAFRQGLAASLGVPAASAYGSAAAARSEGGRRAMPPVAGMPPACTGPVSFCNVYAGS
ncbi:DUF4148 domain-containing protein [Burkholderia perseverans]|uniref:DUF4148 domain-containing protein n=1 Tax=Burkholderia perseverans TaxID=2615214 RepID=UPI001FEDA6DD|nr:DUF4148 domain-containing protein [Burkholderia perseverans]